jgi:hypothetical protein
LENYILVVTKILNISTIQEKYESTTVSIVQKNHLSLISKIIKENGKVLHKGTDGNIIAFDNSVMAVDAVVKIMKSSRNSKNSLPPPALAILIISHNLEIVKDIPLLVMDKIKSFFKSAGSGEILLSEVIAIQWRELGNRRLEDVPRKCLFKEKDYLLYRLKWDSKSKESKKSIRNKGTLYAFLILIPSLIIFIILSFINFNGEKSNSKSMVIAGPFYSKYHHIKCGELNPYIPVINRKLISFCNLGPKGVNYHKLKYGSIQISGRVKRDEVGLKLITELTTLPPEIIYNRAVLRLQNLSKGELVDVFKKSVDLLMESYDNPVSMDQFKGMFLLCGLDVLPKFSLKYEKAEKRVIFLKSYNNGNCIKDVIFHLPKGIEGVIK